MLPPLFARSTLDWHPASSPPDDDVEVLVLYRRATGDLSIWPGYIDCGEWRYETGMTIGNADVIAWADFPEPPEVSL